MSDEYQPSVYYDTNCIGARKNDKALIELKELHKLGKISLEQTNATGDELQKGYKPGRKESLKYGTSFGPHVSGYSQYSGVPSDKRYNDDLLNILTILWGKKNHKDYTDNEMSDARNICSVVWYQGDYFITYEKALLAKSEEIKQKLRIKKPNVCKPAECLRLIKNHWQGENNL